MKKFLFVIPVVASLAACSTTSDPYEKRANYERERSEAAVEKAIDKAPKWMTKLPESKDAVYANGTAVSRDFSMADEKAKVVALGKICTAAGGEVDKNSKVFMSDTETSSTERSETAIRTMCRSVDVTGAEIVDTVRISDNGRFRTYVLMSLPTGDANTLQKRKDRLRENSQAVSRADAAFKELDANNKR